MRKKTWFILFLAIPALFVPGCNAGDGEESVGYKTVVAEPMRDTEAARRANQAGLEHLDSGQLDQAEEDFRRALTADVEFAPAHNNLGKVYFQQERWYKAAWEFEYARKLLPRYAEPYNNLGLVLERAGELDQAVENYRKAVSLDSDNVE